MQVRINRKLLKIEHIEKLQEQKSLMLRNLQVRVVEFTLFCC